jgi:hypothetical protein
MPWWIEEWRAPQLTAMRALMGEMKHRKPRGWSVVMGQNELVLRPADRGLGRFGITLTRGVLRIAFHDRRLNRWKGGHEVPADAPDTAAQLLSWAQRAAADAEERRVSGERMNEAQAVAPGASAFRTAVEG